MSTPLQPDAESPRRTPEQPDPASPADSPPVPPDALPRAPVEEPGGTPAPTGDPTPAEPTRLA